MDTITAPNRQSARQRADALNQVYLAAIDNRFAVAVWRDPSASGGQAVVDLSGSVGSAPVDFCMPAGFCISPFDEQLSGDARWVSAHLHFHDASFRVDPTVEESRKLRENKERFLRAIQQPEPIEPRRPWFARSGSGNGYIAQTRAEYEALIEKTRRKLQEGPLRKVVLSRALEVGLRKDFAPFLLFENLCRAYPTAFVSLVALPGIGVWIGATPELLLRLEEDALTTVALAGTLELQPRAGLAQRAWTDKEVVEQEIVRDFVRDCFRRLKFRGYLERPTKSVRIGNLLHLQTQFELKHLSQYGKGAAAAFLKALHPTPAVCGAPKNPALDYIRDVEPHDREFYTGFLGPVNLRGRSRLFVNLRCLQLLESSAVLYAGGGITVDSQPEKEWLETEMKLEALLRFVQLRTERASPSSEAVVG